MSGRGALQRSSCTLILRQQKIPAATLRALHFSYFKQKSKARHPSAPRFRRVITTTVLREEVNNNRRTGCFYTTLSGVWKHGWWARESPEGQARPIMPARPSKV